MRNELGIERQTSFTSNPNPENLKQQVKPPMVTGFKSEEITKKPGNVIMADDAYRVARTLRMPVRSMNNLREWILPTKNDEGQNKSEENLNGEHNKFTRDQNAYNQIGEEETTKAVDKEPEATLNKKENGVNGQGLEETSQKEKPNNNFDNDNESDIQNLKTSTTMHQEKEEAYEQKGDFNEMVQETKTEEENENKTKRKSSLKEICMGIKCAIHNMRKGGDGNRRLDFKYMDVITVAIVAFSVGLYASGKLKANIQEAEHVPYTKVYIYCN